MRYAAAVHSDAGYDGGWLIPGPVSHDKATRLVLGYGPLAEALVPDELRERVMREARAMVKVYENGHANPEQAMNQDY